MFPWYILKVYVKCNSDLDNSDLYLILTLASFCPDLRSGHNRFRTGHNRFRSGQGRFREIGRPGQSDLGHFFPVLGHFFPVLGQDKVTFAKSAGGAKVT